MLKAEISYSYIKTSWFSESNYIKNIFAATCLITGAYHIRNNTSRQIWFSTKSMSFSQTCHLRPDRAIIHTCSIPMQYVSGKVCTLPLFFQVAHEYSIHELIYLDFKSFYLKEIGRDVLSKNSTPSSELRDTAAAEHFEQFAISTTTRFSPWNAAIHISFT